MEHVVINSYVHLNQSLYNIYMYIYIYIYISIYISINILFIDGHKYFFLLFYRYRTVSDIVSLSCTCVCLFFHSGQSDTYRSDHFKSDTQSIASQRRTEHFKSSITRHLSVVIYIIWYLSISISFQSCIIPENNTCSFVVVTAKTYVMYTYIHRYIDI